MKPKSPWFLSALVLLTSALLYTPATELMASDQLIIYSGRSDKFVKPVLKKFTEKTGIDVIVHAGKSTALLNKLKIEGKRTGADLFISNDAGTLQKGSDFELFAALDTSLISPVKSNYRAPDNTWVGLSARARVLVVNNSSDLKTRVTSVFDLSKPALKGRIGITNSSNESFIAGTTVYMLSNGQVAASDWLNGLKDNVGSKVFNKHSKIVKAVASGKLEIGLVNHYYIYRHLTKKPDAPVSILIPDQGKDGMGVAWNVAGIAVSRYSKNRKLAEQLIAYLVSAKGQRQFSVVNREYPTREDVPASEDVPKANSIKVADIPMFELGHQRNKTLDLIDKAGMP